MSEFLNVLEGFADSGEQTGTIFSDVGKHALTHQNNTRREASVAAITDRERVRDLPAEFFIGVLALQFANERKAPATVNRKFCTAEDGDLVRLKSADSGNYSRTIRLET